MVVPVLDGLDEMDADAAPGFSSRAGKAIRACNAFLDGDRKAALVLTCRTAQYEALERAREWDTMWPASNYARLRRQQLASS